MLPTYQTRLDRIDSCLVDLSDNGIQLAHADERRVAQVVRQYLEYFQLMLGYDSDACEVLALIRRRNADR